MTNRTAFLSAPKDAAPLAAFRIVFGALMAFEAFASYLHKIPERYAPDMFHFTYPFFSWVVPPPGIGIYLLVIIMGLAAFFVTIGYRYRLAAAVFLVTYTYVFLIEASAYNNHYYLIILLAFLFTIVDAHADASMDTARLPAERRGWVPAWQIYIFRAQIVLVYFYGGIAKLNADWLQLHPIAYWLQWRAEGAVIEPLLKSPLAPYVFSYGGLLFDLSIGFLLLWRRSRPLAIVLVIFFHLTNAYLFSIGVFPWLGIGATVLFLEGDTVRRILHRAGFAGRQNPLPESPATPRRHRWALVFCAVYLAVQLAMPLRHWYFPGNVNWTEEGHPLSWRMKLRDKEGIARFAVVDRQTGERHVIDQTDLAAILTDKQVRILPGQPDLIRQYAHHLHEHYRAKGLNDPAVYAEALVSLNGRPYQSLVDPDVDLARVQYRLLRSEDWILPLDPAARPGVLPPAPAFGPEPPGTAPTE